MRLLPLMGVILKKNLKYTPACGIKKTGRTANLDENLIRGFMPELYLEGSFVYLLVKNGIWLHRNM